MEFKFGLLIYNEEQAWRLTDITLFPSIAQNKAGKLKIGK